LSVAREELLDAVRYFVEHLQEAVNSTHATALMTV
jgi:hypothetical protein